MKSSDFDFVTTTEDDESTIVAFKSSTDPGAALGTGFNAYYSIEGIQMDEAQHENCKFNMKYTKKINIILSSNWYYGTSRFENDM